jgi:hypothetical protein
MCRFRYGSLSVAVPSPQEGPFGRSSPFELTNPRFDSFLRCIESLAGLACPPDSCEILTPLFV